MPRPVGELSKVESVPQPLWRVTGAASSGVLQKGLRYEAALGGWLLGKFPNHVLSGQWFKYTSKSGHSGYCQTDFLIVKAHKLILLECKLTETDKAYPQLTKLYFPVVDFWRKKLIGPKSEIILVQAFKNANSKATRNGERLVSLEDAFQLSHSAELVHTFQWRPL